jgi:titin
MRTALRTGFGSALLFLCALGCDERRPFEPDLEAARGGSGSLAAPSNASATAVSDSRIDVSWQDNSGNEDGFEVHRSTTGPAGTFTLRASIGAGGTSFSDAGLSHSTEYCYKVRAFRSSKGKTSYSAFSSTACATTSAPPPPAAPSGLDARPQSSTAIDVSWTDNATTEDGFRVERSTDGGAAWTVAGTTRADSATWTFGMMFTDSGRASEQPVCYRVIAFNAWGDSPPSNTDCTTPPAGPTNLTAVLLDTLVFEVELTWTDNSASEDGYEVYRLERTECCEWWQLLDSLPANTTSYRFYYFDFYSDAYSVAATKDGGYSDRSNPATPTWLGGSSAVATARRPLWVAPPRPRSPRP